MQAQGLLTGAQCAAVSLVVTLSTSAAAMDTDDADRVAAIAALESPADAIGSPLPQTPPLQAFSAEGSPSAFASYWQNWSNRVHAAQASQPHWMTPIATVTPRLEQEVRYDQYWELLPNSGHMNVFDSGKGLELIPTETNEVLINAPPYDERTEKKPAQSFTDWQFLVVKQRLLSADESHGNYILTSFLGVTAPRNQSAFSSHTWMVTPTIAGGVGWGDFDVQATVGSPIPMRLASSLGYNIATNVALQYHLYNYFWPEFEVNDTKWISGTQRHGLNQVYLTPALILGRFPMFDNACRLIVGAGYQYAVEPKQRTVPVNTPAYGHAWIGTARIAF